MSYLEYELSTKQVIEIHDSIPIIQTGYDYAISDDFTVGEEFEKTIWINSVDENKNVTSYAAIRNNPNAQRLLRENADLKAENVLLRAQNQALADRTDFHEEVLAEIILTITP